MGCARLQWSKEGKRVIDEQFVAADQQSESMLTPVQCEHQNWTTERGKKKKVDWSDGSGCIMGRRRALDDALLGNVDVLPFM